MVKHHSSLSGVTLSVSGILYLKEMGTSVCITLLGLSHRIPQTGQLKQRTDTYVFHSSGGWMSKIKLPTGLFWWELSSWLAHSCLLAVRSHDLSSRHMFSWCLCLTRTLVLWVRAPTLWPHLNLITSLKALSPNTVFLRVRAQLINRGRIWGRHNPVHNNINVIKDSNCFYLNGLSVWLW